jgi:D-beta-D-heptose 7-phosphate kinase/D-beta-D-heptose 1-phosphate adenosyltransferase
MKSRFLDSVKQKNILIIGDIILECKKVGKCNRISPEAPVPIVNIENEFFSLGNLGKLLNLILKEDSNCELISVIGQDKAGNFINNFINEMHGVNNLLIIDSLKNTPEEVIVYSNQQLLRIDINDQNPLPTSIENLVINIFKERINFCDVILVLDLNKGVVTRKTYQEIISTAEIFSKKINLCTNIDSIYNFDDSIVKYDIESLLMN